MNKNTNENKNDELSICKSSNTKIKEKNMKSLKKNNSTPKNKNDEISICDSSNTKIKEKNIKSLKKNNLSTENKKDVEIIEYIFKPCKIPNFVDIDVLKTYRTGRLSLSCRLLYYNILLLAEIRLHKSFFCFSIFL